MAVTFVLGRAGSGKTHRCFTSIVDTLKKAPVGPPILWLLPRQATFSAERELTCNSTLGGFLRARVLSFEQFGHEILREQGGAEIPEITSGGRQMILGLLLRRHAASLKFFKGVARQPGLAAKLDATFGDLERCGKNAADLRVLLKEMTAHPADDTAALLDKIHDLHLIYNAYSEYLGQDRLDQHQRLLNVLRLLENCNWVRDAVVYVDGFTEFSEYERRVLARLGRLCRHLEITLPIDPRSEIIASPDLRPAEMSLFHKVENTYRRLRIVFREEQVPVDHPPVLLSEVHRFRTAALRAVEKYAFGTAVTHVQRSAEGIYLTQAVDRAAEVDAAARHIKSLLAAGHRLRDIAVLVRDLSTYDELIQVSFSEHGIRYFVDRRRETAHHPLLHLVRSILMIAQQTWPHEWLMALVKTGLAGLSRSESDALENYVLAHRITGEAWAAKEPWAFGEKKMLAGEQAETADEVEGAAATPALIQVDQHRRAIVDAMSSVMAMGRTATVRQIATALFTVLERLPVRATLARWMADAERNGEYALKNEHAQVWAKLVALFDEMVELVGEEAISIGGFQEILEAGLNAFDLGVTPPTVDEVLVGQVDRTRTPELKAVLVLGLNEGCFPRPPAEDSVLSDGDRFELHRRSVEVAPSGERRLLDEHLLGYLAFTSAAESLYLSRATMDSARKPLGASAFYRRMEGMFPTATRTVIAGNEPELIGTPRQLVTSLMQWVRQLDESEPLNPEAPWPALYQWLVENPQKDDAVARVRDRAWRALEYDNAVALSPDIAGQLFTSPLTTDVRQLETFAACPFRHYLQYGLALQPRDEDHGVTGMDLGQVYHRVLDRVVSDLLRDRKTWADLSDSQKDRVVKTAVQRIGSAIRNEVMLSTARNRYLLARIEHTLGSVISTQKAIAGRGTFSTAFSNVRFGDKEPLPPYRVTTPHNHQLRLRGKIDRIDLRRGSGEACAIDYRLSENTLSLMEVYHGLSLELLTYLLVLEASGEVLSGRKLTPAAAFYVRMLRWMGDVKHPTEAIGQDDPAFHLATKPRGVIDQQFAQAMDTELTTGTSEVISAMIKKDGTFGKKNSTDVATAQELSGLLNHVRQRLGELADGVLEGNIAIAPYMIGTKTPCPQCSYRVVCRFETHGYRAMSKMNREEVLRLMVKDGVAAVITEGEDE
jgi:ATP-dependent helicase/nuclease subunit B